MSGDVSFKFSGAFSNVTALLSSLWSDKKCNNARKLPWFLEFSDSSSPRKARSYLRRKCTQSIDAFKQILYSLRAWSNCLEKKYFKMLALVHQVFTLSPSLIMCTIKASNMFLKSIFRFKIHKPCTNKRITSCLFFKIWFEKIAA